MISHHPVKLSAKVRGNHLVTEEILKHIKLPTDGLMNIFIQHTSAALAINENASPEVLTDLAVAFDRLVPEDPALYTHTEEGPDDMPAHVKSIMSGHAVSIPIQGGQPLLGRWQGIYLMEFRNNAGPRNVIVTLIS